MNYKTHILFGFFLGLFIIQYLSPKNQALFLIVVVISSLLPDIDHPNSKIGRKAKPISFLFEHRGFFHSIFFVIIINSIFWWYDSLNVYLLGFNIGYISHILLDALNPKGIMLFHPLSKKKIKGFIKSGGLFEGGLFLVLFILSIYKLIML